MPLEIGLSLVGALLSFASIERPFNQRKRHFAAVQTDRQDGTATRGPSELTPLCHAV